MEQLGGGEARGVVQALAERIRVEVHKAVVGQDEVLEAMIAALLIGGHLLVEGVPGTAKTWVSEHLAAAISGDSTLLVQGTAGTPEEALRYGWNYARLLAEGPSEAALVESPVLRGMRTGALVRIEELRRIPADVEGALLKCHKLCSADA